VFDLPEGPRYLGASLNLPPIRTPRRIRTGDLVGVIAPSGVVDEQRLRAGLAVLEGWGVRVVLGQAVLERERYLAGTDEARGADVTRMLVDAEVRAVFCARGGYGSQRLLPLVDLSALAAAPKAIVGYSDATALLAAALHAGVGAVHGPMVADDVARGLTPRSETHLWRLLSDPRYRFELEVPEVVRPGVARGRLVGGCLSVLAATLGTPWAAATDGAILFLEDVGERPYRLDRLLTHLRQTGSLARIAGLVFGTFARCPAVDGVTPLDVVRACCADLPCPVGFGLPAGHASLDAPVENLALPLGITVSLDTVRGRLTALEAAVV
jgi:muramoyltetrapeptide carboxypeptidase